MKNAAFHGAAEKEPYKYHKTRGKKKKDKQTDKKITLKRKIEPPSYFVIHKLQGKILVVVN